MSTGNRLLKSCSGPGVARRASEEARVEPRRHVRDEEAARRERGAQRAEQRGAARRERAIEEHLER